VRGWGAAIPSFKEISPAENVTHGRAAHEGEKKSGETEWPRPMV
jgi:hypothetical protein